MSQKELTRYDVLRRVLDGTISLKDAAAYLVSRLGRRDGEEAAAKAA